MAFKSNRSLRRLNGKGRFDHFRRFFWRKQKSVAIRFRNLQYSAVVEYSNLNKSELTKAFYLGNGLYQIFLSEEKYRFFRERHEKIKVLR